ncbi:hypothetical protein MHU86_25506 [Fragilaria crotonensis]|nr:hypothetical protein MHU86_25506 [Fragilaria crotonensis]
MKLITEPERDYLLQLVEKRRMMFMYGDAHGIAYLLDPRYLGAGMSLENRLRIEDSIVAHQSSDSDSTPTAEQQQSVFEDYTNFRISVLEMKHAGSIAWGMLQSNRIGPLKFWLSHGDSLPSLQQLAKQVFSMVASSAASERNFSAFAHVHTKLRNRLSDDVVEKLVYIRTNNAQFTKQDSKQAGVEHPSVDEEEYIAIPGSDSDCQSSILGSHNAGMIEL